VSESKGTSDEAIGRPKPWGEGRYQQPGKPVDDTVDTEAKPEQQPEAPKGVPVTRKDYEQP
jgi:hypothetical protein